MKRKNAGGESVSKTAKASIGKGKAEAFKASGDMNRIISLNGGQHAYLLDPRTGSTYHLLVGSDRWNTLIEELAVTEHGPDIERELKALGWV